MSAQPRPRGGSTLPRHMVRVRLVNMHPNAQRSTKTSKGCVFIATPVEIFVVNYLKDIETELVAKETRERLCFLDRATLLGEPVVISFLLGSQPSFH